MAREPEDTPNSLKWELAETALEALKRLPFISCIISVPDYRFQFANQAALNLFHTLTSGRLSDVHGRHTWQVFPKWWEQLKSPCETVRSTGQSMELEDIRYVFKRSVSYWDITLVPIPDSTGKTTSIQIIGIDVTERRQAEEALRKNEEHMAEFYKRTILAATDGKLIITERNEIETVAGPALASWSIENAQGLKAIRHGMNDLLLKAGMDETRAAHFILVAGEAMTNSLKHADGGTASLHLVPNGLLAKITDRGPGIETLSLPDVALTQGYSTAGTLGMGYKTMISLADKVYLATSPAGTMVAVEMSLTQDEDRLILGISI